MRRALYWFALIGNAITFAFFFYMLFIVKPVQMLRTGSDLFFVGIYLVLPIVTIAALIWHPHRNFEPKKR